MTGDRYRGGRELELALKALAYSPHPLTELAVAHRSVVIGAASRTPAQARRVRRRSSWGSAPTPSLAQLASSEAPAHD